MGQSIEMKNVLTDSYTDVRNHVQPPVQAECLMPPLLIGVGDIR